MALELTFVFTLRLIPTGWVSYMIGPIVALGRQEEFIPATIIGYWVINVPLAFLFTFSLGYSLTGMWWAQLLGQLYLGLCQFRIIKRVDWYQAIHESLTRQS